MPKHTQARNPMTGQAVRRQFHTLDMLRGIAALAVVALHMGREFASFLPSSHLAVDLFFVLSGFVLAHAYGNRFGTEMSFGRFLTIRMIRLYPLYFLGTSFGALLVLASIAGGEVIPWSDYLGSLVLGAAFLPTPQGLSTNEFHVFPFNFPAWSLFWELIVNVVFALVASRLSNRVLSLLIGIGFLFLLFGAWAYEGLAGGSNFSNFPLGGMRVLFSFFAGVAAYRIWSAGKFRFQLPPLLAGLLLLGVLAVPRDPMFDVAAVLLFPLFVLSSTKDPKIGLVPVFTSLGLMSFPLYALHAPFVLLYRLLRDSVGDISAWSLEVAFLGGMILVALLADRLFDRRVRKALSTFANADARARAL